MPDSSAVPPAVATAVPGDFQKYLAARLLLVLGFQMQSVAVGQQVYLLTHRPLDLGYVGLAQFLPAVLLSLVTGDVADRVDRKRILQICYATIALCMAALCWISHEEIRGLTPLYVVLVMLGTARAFMGPAASALLPQLVPAEGFQRAVALNSSVWEIATIGGPALGGFLYLPLGPQGVYALCTVLTLSAALAVLFLRSVTVFTERRAPGWKRTLEGVRYVWRRKVVLGAISLDLFAVLLGGAVALLPVYAQDILHTGPWGYGLLRSAPAVGAGTIALVLAQKKLERNAGLWMFGCVGLFGIATIVFGLSRSFPLSLAALVVLGGADMVSVVIRSSLVQLATPSEMRGRVSAVNLVFVGASNELGEFESGVTAAWLGAVPAVIAGGVGTLVVVGLWMFLFPQLRRIHSLDEVGPESG